MRHVILTCKNHSTLRWSTKEIAVNPDGSYNGCRNISFMGSPTGEGMYSDGSGLHCSQITPAGTLIRECDCSARDLCIAPEDVLVKREE